MLTHEQLHVHTMSRVHLDVTYERMFLREALGAYAAPSHATFHSPFPIPISLFRYRSPLADFATRSHTTSEGLLNVSLGRGVDVY
jgi:hypothetical protein